MWVCWASGAKVRVRGGKPADAKALANVFKDSWLFAYRGIIPQRHLDSMVRQRSPEWWRAMPWKTGDSTLVLDVGGAAAGYATLGNSRQQRGATRVRSTSPILIRSIKAWASASTCSRAAGTRRHARALTAPIVWALLGNSSACDFYWRRGGRPVASTFTRIGGERLERSPSAWG